jgi:hypothetical protein
MDTLALMAKAGLAAVLLVAAGAKLADLDGFALTVRLFLPRLPGPARPARPPRGASALAVRRAAAAIVGAEFALGAASLCCPAVAWLNLAVLGAGCSFVAVAAAGYVFYRGRSCSCFGALSRRKFDAAGIARAAVIAAAAAVAVVAVPPSAVRLGAPERVLLLAAACLLAAAAGTAARALAVGRAARPELAAR